MHVTGRVSRLRAWWKAEERERSTFDRAQWRRYRRWEVASFVVPIIAALLICASRMIGPWPGIIAIVAWSWILVSARELEPDSD